MAICIKFYVISILLNICVDYTTKCCALCGLGCTVCGVDVAGDLSLRFFFNLPYILLLKELLVYTMCCVCSLSYRHDVMCNGRWNGRDKSSLNAPDRCRDNGCLRSMDWQCGTNINGERGMEPRAGRYLFHLSQRTWEEREHLWR